ncbi:hypothetical protein [Parapedobacter tibetensis]|uniref:hypothetical protein n=1 Tax=Parapedobacter tibetensis TaxID=2972951 RepID=UPI00214DD921|nr:hypothetical protein [Parapedobacter tibetensis]
MRLKRNFGCFSVKDFPFLDFGFLKVFETEYVYCSYIELDAISGVTGTILLSIYTSEKANEKLVGDIICYPLRKTGSDKFIPDRVEDVVVKMGDLPSFRYVSDSGSLFYLPEGKYLLMSAVKAKDRDLINHLNYFFIHSDIHVRFKIALEYFKLQVNSLSLNEDELYTVLLTITNRDKITKRFSEEEKRELIDSYLKLEKGVPSYKDIPDCIREKVVLK